MRFLLNSKSSLSLFKIRYLTFSFSFVGDSLVIIEKYVCYCSYRPFSTPCMMCVTCEISPSNNSSKIVSAARRVGTVVEYLSKIGDMQSRTLNERKMNLDIDVVGVVSPPLETSSK